MRPDRPPACAGTSPPLLLNRLPSSRASDYDAIVTYSGLSGCVTSPLSAGRLATSSRTSPQGWTCEGASTAARA